MTNKTSAGAVAISSVSMPAVCISIEKTILKTLIAVHFCHTYSNRIN